MTDLRVKPTTIVASLILGATVVGAGCQAVIDADVVQCDTASDCDARGGDFAGRDCVEHVCRRRIVDAGSGEAEAGPVDPIVGCAGAVTWSAQDLSRKVRIRRRFIKLIGEAPIVDLHVLACSSVDPECTSPYAEGRTDAKGDVILDVPFAFRGYLHMPEAPSTFSDMMPHLYAIYPPPEKDTDLSVEPRTGTSPILVSLGELNILLAQVGASVDPALGHLSAQVYDCLGNPLAGANVRSNTRDPKTIQYYYSGNNTPSLTAEATNETGVTGMLNLPPGVIGFDVTVPAIGKKFGTYSVLFKKGAVTIVDMAPTPL